MNNLTKQFFILCLSFITSTVFAQQSKYHRIESHMTETQFQKLMQDGLDIDHYHYHDGHLIAEVSDADILIFKSNQVAFTYMIKDLAKNIKAHNAKIDKQAAKTTRAVTVPTPLNFGTGGTYGSGTGAKHFTFQDLQNELDQMRALYPNLITVKSSIGTTIEGRSLFMVKMSDNADTDEMEPEIFLNAVHHAREPMSMTQLIFFMWHVLENYETDKEIRHILNSSELYIVPCVNPDGYVYNQTTNSTGGGMWRKNRVLNSNGTYGVDNNRNYSYGWGGAGASATPSSETYRGTAAFSELENQAVKDFCNARQFVSAFNYHAYGNYCIYPYSNVSVNNNPEIPLFNQLSVFLTEDNAFTYGNAQATVNYVSSGGAEDWAYAEQTTKGKMYGFTPEVGLASDGFYPASSRIIPLCNSMIVMNKNLLKVSTKFATVTPSLAASTTSINSTIPIAVKNFSLLASTYTITINPLSSYVTSIDAAKTFSNIAIFQTQNDAFNFTLDASTPVGTPIQFEVVKDNGLDVWKDTITTTYNCATPSGVATFNVTTNSALLFWNALSGATDYYVSYKENTSSTWGTEILVTGNSYQATGLNNNTSYVWKVREANCSVFTLVQSFTTLIPCGIPNPTSSNVTNVGFTLNWAAVSGATTYNVQYKPTLASVWTSVSQTGTSRTISGLTANTSYQFQVNAVCPSGASAYSAVGTVTTASNPTVTYCASNGSNNNLFWIDYINLGGITRSSNKETGGYINTGLSTTLTKGTSNTITFSAGFASTVYRVYWRVFIDLNGDGDFADAGENVVNTNKTGTGNYTATFTIPTSATASNTRMRVKMNYQNNSSPCGTFTYGEVEDYNITLASLAFKTDDIEVASQEIDVTASPNPFEEIIHIRLNNLIEPNTSIALFDIQGRKVYEALIENQNLNHDIPSSELPSGHYILQVQNGHSKKSVKLVK